MVIAAPFDVIVDRPALTAPPVGSAFAAGSASTFAAYSAPHSAVVANSPARSKPRQTGAMRRSWPRPAHAAAAPARRRLLISNSPMLTAKKRGNFRSKSPQLRANDSVAETQWLNQRKNRLG